MLTVGSLLLVTPYSYPVKAKSEPKFCLGLCDIDGKALVITLPSSQIHFPFPDKNIKSGCIWIEEAGMRFFCFLAGEICTDKGFSFNKDTFLYDVWADIVDIETFNRNYPNEGQHFSFHGKLKDSLIATILKCLYDSPSIKRNIKKALAPIIGSGIDF